MWTRAMRAGVALLVVALFALVRGHEVDVPPPLQAHASGPAVVQLTTANYKEILDNNDFVFVNFYADWCRFSQMLKPVYLATGEALRSNPATRAVVMAQVDCDQQEALAKEFHISKFPTMKFFRHGKVSKREYRGQRTVQALSAFITEQQVTAWRVLADAAQVHEATEGQRKPMVFGQFANAQAAELFRVVSEERRDDCQFVMTVDPDLAAEPEALPYIYFKKNKDDVSTPFPRNAPLSEWASEMCDPLVKEITFANGEELTERGLPFLIFFHHPDDKNSPVDFKNYVEEHFHALRDQFQFLTADGVAFAHPLGHMGKTKQDLPVLAIDSFRHMYDFGDVAHMKEPGKLQQFLDDLLSGALHHRLHNTTPPPESKFKKLEPSDKRYSFSRGRDEL